MIVGIDINKDWFDAAWQVAGRIARPQAVAIQFIGCTPCTSSTANKAQVKDLFGRFVPVCGCGRSRLAGFAVSPSTVR